MLGVPLVISGESGDLFTQRDYYLKSLFNAKNDGHYTDQYRLVQSTRSILMKQVSQCIRGV